MVSKNRPQSKILIVKISKSALQWYKEWLVAENKNNNFEEMIHSPLFLKTV